MGQAKQNNQRDAAGGDQRGREQYYRQNQVFVHCADCSVAWVEGKWFRLQIVSAHSSIGSLIWVNRQDLTATERRATDQFT
jgi:hypothetical protein